jgi:hypothetical protein
LWVVVGGGVGGVSGGGGGVSGVSGGGGCDELGSIPT